MFSCITKDEDQLLDTSLVMQENESAGAQETP